MMFPLRSVAVRVAVCALPAATSFEVELEIAVRAGHRERFDRRSRERRAAKVCVQDHPAGVYDPPDPRRCQPAQPSRYPPPALGVVKNAFGALGPHLLADRLHHLRPAEFRDHCRVFGLVDEPAYTRQGFSALNPGIRYPMH